MHAQVTVRPLVFLGLVLTWLHGLARDPETTGASPIEIWRERIVNAQKSGDRRGEMEALFQLAATYQNSGQVRNARRTFEEVRTAAEKGRDENMTLQAEAALAELASFSQEADSAEDLLKEQLTKATEKGNQLVAARIHNALGNIFAARNEHAAAKEAYRNAAECAALAGDHLLDLKARMNLAGSLAALSDRDAKALLQKLIAEIGELSDSSAKLRLLISAAERLREISKSDGLAAATSAFRLAKQMNDLPAMADSLGIVASLYESQHRYEEALRAASEASLHAQSIPHLQYRLEWQKGRLLAAMQRRADALAAYRRAVATADSIRHDLAIGIGNANRRSSFRAAIGPLYFELTDLLLQQAAGESDAGKKQAALEEARDTLELLKSAELVDYFQDDCVNLLRAKTTGIEKISPTAAIIYLIPLPTRTELLVGLDGRWEQFSVAVGEAELSKVIRSFREHLETRTSYEYLTEARQLYAWLIAPLESTLTRQGVDTLVFVPDGAARTIPLGALHDGKDFLISRYAVAVSPGAKLTDPRTVERKSAQLLLGGLSKPVQGFLPMTCVPRELEAIARLQSSTVLLDARFSSERMAGKFEGESYSIVHLASHGRFDRDARKTFILTNDSRMTLDDLERMVRPGQFHGRPVELMTLSACQTAAGDDRAALGMAGVAVKSGARCAVASLWFVNDQSSSELIASFYQNLWKDPTRSKAQAMQKAQQAMLANRAYQHPCYWAPYLVIGNWL